MKSKLQVNAPVAKTAKDAIRAKLSASDGNYPMVPPVVPFQQMRPNGKQCRNVDSVNGNASSSHDLNGQRVYRDLLLKFNSGKVGRQTPLVNAGYAVRVAAISSTLVRFLVEHCVEEDDDESIRKSNHPSTCINVVFLGAGMDVLGLWTAFMAHQEQEETHDQEEEDARRRSISWRRNIQIYEVDCMEMVKAKREVLIKSDLLASFEDAVVDCQEKNSMWNDMPSDHNANDHHDENHDENHENVLVFKACVDSKKQEKDKQMDHWNYCLMAADLRDVDSVHTALFQRTNFDASNPTIVISELVLAYLQDGGDKKVEYLDNLIQYISSHLCITRNSLFVAYEPVLPGESDGSKKFDDFVAPHRMVSTLKGYSLDYFSRFVSQLDRGSHAGKQHRIHDEHGVMSRVQEDEHSKSRSFAPVGQSSTDVIRRLRTCGFDGITSCTSMSRAIEFFRDILHHGAREDPPEIFDEYAAFHLHLYCYSIICATGTEQRNDSDPSLDVNKWMTICPWLVQNMDGATRGGLGKYHSNLNMAHESKRKFTLLTIQKEHEEEVRNLFKASYSYLFDAYPSVKKLVKSALKNDLNTKVSQNMENHGGVMSAIWDHYAKSDGAFWVILANDVQTSEDKSKQGFGRPLLDGNQIVGYIGIKKRKGIKPFTRSCDVSYEIHRFVVSPSFQGQGFGQKLMRCVEAFVVGKETHCNVELVAITPKILERSNKFYLACGFHVGQEALLGKLVICTYVKVIASVNCEITSMET